MSVRFINSNGWVYVSWSKWLWARVQLQSLNQNKIYKTLEYWFRDMLNFDFLEKGLGIVSLPHFVYNFSRKIFLMLYSINWRNFITWLYLLIEILVNMFIANACYCDVTDFEIDLIYLIKPFSFMTKKSRQKFKYLKNEKSF